MKPENFDDLIKDKLDNLSFPATDAEVDAVFSYVKKHKTWYNTRPGKWFIGSAAGLVLSGLLVFTTMQYQKNKELESKINRLETEQKIAAKAGDSQTGKKNEEAATNDNTVYYPAEKTGKTGDRHEQNYSTEAAVQEEAHENTGTVHVNAGKNIAKGKEKNNNNKEGGKDEGSVAVKDENNNQKDPPVVLQDSAENKEENSNPATQDSIAVAGTVNYEGENAPDTSEGVPVNNSKGSKQKLLVRLGDYLKGSPTVRVGIDFTAGRNIKGIGAFASAGLGKNWSISAGPRFLSVDRGIYHDNFEYNKTTGKDFRMQFGPMPHDTIKNIRVSGKLLQLPVSLGYSFKLAYGFRMAASAGITYNIAGKEEARFERPDPFRHTPLPDSRNRQLPGKTESADFSLGISREFNRLGFLLAPYYSYHFLVVPAGPQIRNDAAPVNVQLKLWYRIR
jgi:hypothetical protein